MAAAESFTLDFRAEVPPTRVVHSPSTSRNSRASSCSAVTAGSSTCAGMVTVSPGSAASMAAWAASTSNSAPACSGTMESVSAS